MVSFNSPNISQKSNTGILINQHVTVQAAAEITGCNIQYLRWILSSGTLRGCKIGQMWLIEMDLRWAMVEVAWRAMRADPVWKRRFEELKRRKHPQ